MDAYTLAAGDGFSVTVWTYGATLIETLVPDRHGSAANVVLRLPDLEAYEDHERNPYVGATLGRFARCIANASFRIDATEFEVDRNVGRHHFHGGTFGFGRIVWSADASRDGDDLVLLLQLVRPEGDQGYPGALTATAIYRVSRDKRVRFEYAATTTASTVVAFTNHAYWNLGGSGTIDDHLLAVNARRIVEVDSELIPVGTLASVLGTELDYSTGRRIDERSVDACFALDDSEWAAELIHDVSGRTMRLRTDQPALAVYTADTLATCRRGGISLQAGAFPDSPNHPEFGSSRLDPGETYRHCTTHEFATS